MLLQVLLGITEKLLFGYNAGQISEEHRKLIHEVAEKGGTWRDFT